MSALEEYENNRMYHDANGDTGSMMDEADAAIESLKAVGTHGSAQSDVSDYIDGAPFCVADANDFGTDAGRIPRQMPLHPVPLEGKSMTRTSTVGRGRRGCSAGGNAHQPQCHSRCRRTTHFSRLL